jgi:hypothetical protein
MAAGIPMMAVGRYSYSRITVDVSLLKSLSGLGIGLAIEIATDGF